MKYHLIGIGGVSMSAIALMLKDAGHTVTGSDRQESDTVHRLRAEGVTVTVGHAAENLAEPDVVVFNAAIARDNPEIIEAEGRGVALLERPAMLGKLMEPYEHRIGVSGAHGKTTTVSMTSAILERGGFDPTSLFGTDRNNLRRGGSKVILTEACEAFGSFLHLSPSIAVVNNIDADHLDYYGDVEHVEAAFGQFVSRVAQTGCVIACADDERTRRVLGSHAGRIAWFGTDGAAGVRATDIDTSIPRPDYTLVRGGRELGRVRLSVPGRQNVLNSLAAISVGFELGVGFEDARAALSDFRGAARRWDVLSDGGDVMVVDDYAHHPAEIEATLKGARAAYADRHIIAVFQPHLYSRTKHFEEDFADALTLADEVIVTPIYAAREQPMDGVTGENIARRIPDARYWPDKGTLAADLANRAKPGDLILVLGAGDIRLVGEELASLLESGSR